MSVGYLCASFDLLNVSDIDLVDQARKRCSRLVAAVHTDAYAWGLSGRYPVVPLEERIALLQHIRGVDEVVPYDASTEVPLDALQFVVAGTPEAWSGQALIPRRLTASAMLRFALHRQGRFSTEEVA